MFFGCQYAGLVPAPMPLPLAFGGRAAYLRHIRRMIETAGAAAAFAPAALASWLAAATEGIAPAWYGTVADLATLPDAGEDSPGVPGGTPSLHQLTHVHQPCTIRPGRT